MFALRLARTLTRSSTVALKQPTKKVQPIRNASNLYRKAYNPSGDFIYWRQGLMLVMWTWIFYHVFGHTDEMFAHKELPDPATFTDEELGIPPDDAE